MQLTIPRSELKQAVAGLSRVVPKRATLPILQTVRFSHEGGRTTVTGTDLDQSLAFRFAQASAEGAGSFLIGLSDLQLLTKGPDADYVEFRAFEPTSVEISHPIGGQLVGRRITTEDPKEWPALGPKVDAGPVDPAFLTNFRRVATTASSDESRRVLMGVYLDSGKKGDYLVGLRRAQALRGQHDQAPVQGELHRAGQQVHDLDEAGRRGAADRLSASPVTRVGSGWSRRSTTTRSGPSRELTRHGGTSFQPKTGITASP
jgi:hypothetical protein